MAPVGPPSYKLTNRLKAQTFGRFEQVRHEELGTESLKRRGKKQVERTRDEKA
jgi:hypothetical protein